MLKLYNTLTKQKEEFKPINVGKVSLYTCGPTVYDYIHLGNIRAYLTADILRRYLEYSGYEVRQIKNITDAGHLTDDDINQGDSGDDKIAKKALKEKKTPEEIARFYEEKFHETEEKANILSAQYFPRVTAHIPQMIKMIEKLVEKGYAYEVNGNVFFDVTRFPDYGKLSGNTLENLKVGARLEEHPDKKNPWDFALWLKAPANHLMKWESPWSVGYPGWHIECSAMSIEYLGDTMDIHTGGEDNIFPHHEAEIAQSEATTGKKFVNFWIHTRFLLAEDGSKMSKSKGNFLTLNDIQEKGYSFMELRLALLFAHYRTQMKFGWKVLDQAKANLETLRTFHERISQIEDSGEEKIDIEKFKSNFETAMDDDLNTPEAIASMLKLVNEANKLIDANNLGNPRETKKLFETWIKVLGIDPAFEKATIPTEIQALGEERKKARESKDFTLSDEIRDKITSLGYIIEDLKDNNYSIKKK